MHANNNNFDINLIMVMHNWFPWIGMHRGSASRWKNRFFFSRKPNGRWHLLSRARKIWPFTWPNPFLLSILGAMTISTTIFRTLSTPVPYTPQTNSPFISIENYTLLLRYVFVIIYTMYVLIIISFIFRS